MILNLGAESGRYPPELLDHFEGKKLVIVGGARCVWQDLLALNVSADNPNACLGED